MQQNLICFQYWYRMSCSLPLTESQLTLRRNHLGRMIELTYWGTSRNKQKPPPLEMIMYPLSRSKRRYTCH